MKKSVLFLLLLIASLSGFLLAAIMSNFYLAPTTPSVNQPTNWIDNMWNMMNRMMECWTSPAQYNVPSYFWIVPLILIAFAVVAIIGLVYSVAFPEIKTVKASPEINMTSLPAQDIEISASPQPVAPVNTDSQQNQAIQSSYDTIIKTLKPDEHLVLEVLRKHDGKYLQKWIRKETGLTRLKTHRIIARLADRGIVTVKTYGNTNEVALSSWINLDTRNPQNKK
jgi:predicted transcriptional regulator